MVSNEERKLFKQMLDCNSKATMCGLYKALVKILAGIACVSTIILGIILGIMINPFICLLLLSPLIVLPVAYQLIKKLNNKIKNYSSKSLEAKNCLNEIYSKDNEQSNYVTKISEKQQLKSVSDFDNIRVTDEQDFVQ